MIEPAEVADGLIEEIDRLLIPRVKYAWTYSDTTGGGQRRGRDRRLLFWVDLMAVMERAGQGKVGELALRDRAILGLCCGSPLRIREIAELRWESLAWHPQGEVKLFPVWATVERRGAPIELPIYARVMPPLIALRDTHQGLDRAEPAGAIFRELRDPFSGLKYRWVKSIFDSTVAGAGLRGASLLDLKAAFADQLIHAHKISEQHLTGLLGYALHDSMLDLIREHKIWRLNRAKSDNAAERGGSS
jgi:integrase